MVGVDLGCLVVAVVWCGVAGAVMVRAVVAGYGEVLLAGDGGADVYSFAVGVGEVAFHPIGNRGLWGVGDTSPEP